MKHNKNNRQPLNDASGTRLLSPPPSFTTTNSNSAGNYGAVVDVTADHPAAIASNNHNDDHDNSSNDSDSFEIRSFRQWHDNTSTRSKSSDDDTITSYQNNESNEPNALSERLLARAAKFTLPHDVHKGHRGTKLQLLSFERPHMRAFHGSWMSYFVSLFLQFSVCPLLPTIQTSLSLTKSDIWLSNIWSMVGGIPAAFCLGPLCDQFGARVLICALLLACAITCLTTTIITSLQGLLLVRFLMGCYDTFVPGQYWITCHFTRQVVGTAMAISGGWGASGAGIVQLVVGTVLYPLFLTITNDNANLAWRWSLVLPSFMAMYAAYFFYYHSDDCPLGNYKQVKRAGLMMEKSAVDSFRSGALNVNSWILFLQFAGSCGVDLTMCNGTAIYYHQEFNQPIASAGAIAFCYGISSVYARGLGGYVSDVIGDAYSLKGRLVAQMVCMIVQGLVCVWFAHVQTGVVQSMLVMVVFSILIQMSMGTCFGIVSYVDGPNTGTVAGIVGAGGNVGAVWLGIVFMSNDSYQYAIEYMGWFTVVLAFLTPLIVVKGYRGLIFGKEEDLEPRLTLMVPS